MKEEQQIIRKLKYFKFPCGLEIHIEGYEEPMTLTRCPMHGNTCGTKKVREWIEYKAQMPQRF